ncbi:MAG TPA: hypothetical protein VIY48_03800 [Candidatus Paceibacterota bacterium]
MSIKGQSFTGAFSGGAHMDFGVGTAGADTVFASDFTIAVLAKTTNSGWGLFGGYTDTTAATPLRQFFLANNSGGRLYGDGDFTAGFPDPGVDADGINDGTWRWHVMSKATGAAHYKFSYADLATLTWTDGESVSAANHSDNATAAGMFSTWAIYAMGFDTGDMAVVCVWPTQLTTGQIHSSCTQAVTDLKGASSPAVGWIFPQATSGSTVYDFTGGGANEISRPLIATSADPPSFDFVFRVSLAPASIAVSPTAVTPVPGVISVVLPPAPILITTPSIGNIPVSTSFSVVYNTDIPVSGSFSVQYNVATIVSNTLSLIYDVRSLVTQAKVFSVLFDIRNILSKSYAAIYDVTVPVSPSKTVDLSYDVHSSVSNSVSIVYDTAFTGSGPVSRSFVVTYATLKTSSVGRLIPTPVLADKVPPQIVTTTSY